MRTVICILLFATTSINSQSLKLDDIVYIRDKDLAVVEEYLSKRDCKVLEAIAPTAEKMGEITFAYLKRDYSDEAPAFITYYYSDETPTKRVWAQINDLSLYNSFLDRIKTLGMKLIDSKVVDGEIQKTYQGRTTTVVVTISKETKYGNTKNQYFFRFRSNLDHILNFSE